MLLFELFHRKSLYDALPDFLNYYYEDQLLLLPDEIPEEISFTLAKMESETLSLLYALLRKDFKKRPSCEDVLLLPFFHFDEKVLLCSMRNEKSLLVQIVDMAKCGTSDSRLYRERIAAAATFEELSKLRQEIQRIFYKSSKYSTTDFT
eukprot:TRINITY_DN17420_c0_g1_i1.p1 TRINITY_DN17420_c0_g1~~TRINITY_DN17420_c0_g1_i1.p1  ORF type:complete len:149 (-),score=32.81 TRINITY_DN17420_c0_g1_i1:122-568(-)